MKIIMYFAIIYEKLKDKIELFLKGKNKFVVSLKKVI